MVRRTDGQTDGQYMVAPADEWIGMEIGDEKGREGKRSVATPNEEMPFLSSFFLVCAYAGL